MRQRDRGQTGSRPSRDRGTSSRRPAMSTKTWRTSLSEVLPRMFSTPQRRGRQSPDMRGLRVMRRRGLEPPPGYPGPGPQPGNSTVISVRCVPGRPYRPGARTIRTHGTIWMLPRMLPRFVIWSGAPAMSSWRCQPIRRGHNDSALSTDVRWPCHKGRTPSWPRTGPRGRRSGSCTQPHRRKTRARCLRSRDRRTLSPGSSTRPRFDRSSPLAPDWAVIPVSAATVARDRQRARRSPEADSCVGRSRGPRRPPGAGRWRCAAAAPGATARRGIRQG